MPRTMFPYEITAADMQYAQELLQRARSKAEGIFNNSKPYHAAVVMENIFRETREAPREGIIRIYGKNLNGEISGFDNYRYQLTSFLLAPNTKIRVIIDEVPHTKSKSVTNAYQMLSAFSKSKKVGGKINMKKVIAPEKVAALVLQELEFPDAHFAVSSENMYRFEIDSKLHFAECSFNGKSMSEKLTQVFDRMFDNLDDQYTESLT